MILGNQKKDHYIMIVVSFLNQILCFLNNLFHILCRRAKEMAETHYKAHELTQNAEGKHHIGDFLPPDELARFMEKVCIYIYIFFFSIILVVSSLVLFSILSNITL